jgi:hypothetical protein
MPKLRTSINPYAFSFGIFGIITLNKLSSYLSPLQLYFSFSSFIVDKGSFQFGSLLIALSIPCIVGFLLFYLPYRWMPIAKPNSEAYRSIYRYLTRQADLTARTVGFFSSLLLAWPFITYWDILARPDIRDLRIAFLFAYFLFFVAYAYFSGFGVSIALLSLREKMPLSTIKVLGIGGRFGWSETLRTSFMGTLASGIATYLAATLGTPS